MTNKKPKKRRKTSQPGSFIEARALLVIAALGLLFSLVLVRSIQLTVFPTELNSLKKIARGQYTNNIKLAPFRGSILDRRGEPLAISIRRPSLVVNPRVFEPTHWQVSRLAKFLKIKRSRIRKMAEKSASFAWLKRQVDPGDAQKALSLDIEGLYMIKEPTRYYPGDQTLAHLLGFVGIDNQGLTGLEKMFDRDLKGEPIKVTANKDALGNVIYNDATDAKSQKTGHNVHLTIDRAIQEIVEEELSQGVKNAKAKKGYAVVADPHTGKILAVANYPTFNLNRRQTRNKNNQRNAALKDLFEPGSITKPFVLARAIDKKALRATTLLNCENGVYRIGRNKIHDTHKASILSAAQAVVESSNICAFKIAKKLGQEETYKALSAFGVGSDRLSLGINGEAKGRIATPGDWRPIRFATISFGQGFLTSAIEMVSAMSVIANGGLLWRPSIVEKIQSSDNYVIKNSPPQLIERVIKPETAKTMRKILQKVVEDKDGTGENAKSDLYTTAGKTGTAQKVDPGIKGYSSEKFLTSFLGFSPVKDPHLVVLVAIDEPTIKPYYGGTWAAPVFRKIVDRSLKYLNVAPQKTTVAGKQKNLGSIH